MIDKEVLKRLEIFDVATRLHLQHRNGILRCIHPNHEDHHPSMSLNRKTNTFKCFACGCQGDIIKLVEISKGIDFKEACQWLNNTFHLNAIEQKIPIAYPKKSSSLRNTSTPKKTLLAKINKKNLPSLEEKTLHIILEAFFKALSTPASFEEAITILENRGFPRHFAEEIFHQHGVQVVPKNKPERKAIIEKLRTQFDEETITKSNLFSKDDLYFKYHRFLMPAFDLEHQYKTLQGRDIDYKSTVKYLTLKGFPTTPFNLPCLRNLNKGSKIYIVEGFFDTIALEFLEAVSCIGLFGINNLNDTIIDMLKPFEVVVIGDLDAAGEKLVRSSAEKFYKIDKRIKTISIKDIAPAIWHPRRH